jgi:hypothetical protein
MNRVILLLILAMAGGQEQRSSAALLAECQRLPRSKVAGTPADWTHRGDFDGYSVVIGCAQAKDIVPLS